MTKFNVGDKVMVLKKVGLGTIGIIDKIVPERRDNLVKTHEKGNGAWWLDSELILYSDLVEQRELPEKSTQVGGDHYSKLKIDPRSYGKANGLDFDQINVVKYVTRFKDKNGIEDLKKARHYIDLMIEDLEE